ncbi:MAG: MarR family transcriptional regulator [Eggerthellaceae bacterium]|nr:MarR family transcriptional regulator [Eggerthellaceae bacterium]
MAAQSPSEITPEPGAAASGEGSFSLDSTYFVGFEMAHTAFKQGLAASSPLNITQYRFLSKLCSAHRAVEQGEMGAVLGLKPNVVTQAVDALEQAGFVTRTTGATDGRTRTLDATSLGQAHVDAVNEALVKSLYATFPTADARYRTILEAAIFAGSRIEPGFDDTPSKHPASRALVAVELIRQETERTLKTACGATLPECRIVQKLAEAHRPLRLNAIAEALFMSSITVTRAVEKLAARGWVRRLRSEHDRKAVFVDLTDEGVFQADLISATLNELAATRLWANLDAAQKEAIEQMGHTVIAGIQAQKEAQEQAYLNSLSPED